MLQLYQDSMASVLKFGKPFLFITMTANAWWQEITNKLKANKITSDRPDLVTRVFRMKLDSFLKDVVKNNRLGKFVLFVYTIEFQK